MPCRTPIGVLGVDEQRALGVGVRVDEARRDDEPVASMTRPASALDRSPIAAIDLAA